MKDESTKMKTLFSVLLIIFTKVLSAQPGPGFSLKGEISNFSGPTTVYLLVAEGSGFQAIDSIQCQNGRIMFVSDTIPATGQYSVFWGDNHFIDLIIHQEKFIQFTADELESDYAVDIIASKENNVYYKIKKHEQAIDSLSRLGDYYYEQGKASLLTKVKSNIRTRMALMEEELDSIRKATPELFCLKIVDASIPPDFNKYAIANPEHGYPDEFTFMQRHFFDNIDRHDSSLVRTRVIYDACSFYLQNLVADASPESYIKAVDFIISSFSWNDDQYKYVVDLMMNTFETDGYDTVFLHIYDLYVAADKCSDGIPGEQERKALSIRNLSQGSMAPELTGIDRYGVLHKLSDYKGKTILVMFWESSCSHCHEAIPAVLAIIKRYPDVVLFSFSLDTDEQRRVSGELSLNLPEPSVSDSGGYDGANAVRWCIWGTPTFFVIDADGKIKAKPLTSTALEKAF